MAFDSAIVATEVSHVVESVGTRRICRDMEIVVPLNVTQIMCIKKIKLFSKYLI